MHPPHVRAQALALVEAGLNDCEISRRLGVPRRTILDWRRRPEEQYARRVITDMCPRCWRPAKPMRFTPEDYAELLGLYLGDGCISDGPRTQRLRLHLDAKYPDMNSEIRSTLERCFPNNLIGNVTPPKSSWSGRRDTVLILSLYSTHLSCLFPQHAAGKKHNRKIRLEAWQHDLVERAPWALLRGLIRSDGCAFINRTGPHEYLSYDFSNYSKDIVDLFVAACDIVGVVTRVNLNRRRWDVRINRRASVARMLAHVGLKS